MTKSVSCSQTDHKDRTVTRVLFQNERFILKTQKGLELLLPVRGTAAAASLGH